MGTDEKQVHERVRETYAAAAGRAAPDCCGHENGLATTLYEQDQLAELPEEAVTAALGCGNPTALAALAPGEVVLDLGSGGGIDVLASAQRVGPGGFVYGLDMTDEMLELAERNRQSAGVTNVRFLKGQIEDVPLEDATVDIVLSNCVINLSPDKDRVLREAHRVLRPGGRLAIADIVTLGELPAVIRESLGAWTGCLAGALEVSDYEAKLAAAGFVDTHIEVLRTFGRADLDLVSSTTLAEAGLDQLPETAIAEAEGKLASAFVRGWRPAGT